MQIATISLDQVIALEARSRYIGFRSTDQFVVESLSPATSINSQCNYRNDRGDDGVFHRFNARLVIEKILNRVHVCFSLGIVIVLRPTFERSSEHEFAPEVKASSQET